MYHEETESNDEYISRLKKHYRNEYMVNYWIYTNNIIFFFSLEWCN